MLINRSVAHMRAGNLAWRAPTWSAPRRTTRHPATTSSAPWPSTTPGYVALLEGNLVAALESMSEARPVMEQASVVNAAICDLDRAEVLRDAGLSSEAERALERVARVFGAHRMLQARAEAELNLARSQLAHDPATAARTAAADAAKRFRTVDSAAWAAQADGIRVRAELTDGVYDLDGMPAPRSLADAGCGGGRRRLRCPARQRLTLSTPPPSTSRPCCTLPAAKSAGSRVRTAGRAPR